MFSMKMTFLNLFLVETAECTKGIAHLKMKTHVIIYTSSWCPKPYVEYQRKTFWGCEKQHVPLQNYKWVLDLCAWIPSLKTYHLYVRKKLKFYIHVCIHYILFLQKTLSLVHVCIQNSKVHQIWWLHTGTNVIFAPMTALTAFASTK